MDIKLISKSSKFRRDASFAISVARERAFKSEILDERISLSPKLRPRLVPPMFFPIHLSLPRILWWYLAQKLANRARAKDETQFTLVNFLIYQIKRAVTARSYNLFRKKGETYFFFASKLPGNLSMIIPRTGKKVVNSCKFEIETACKRIAASL